MSSGRLSVDVETLRSLYVDEGLTLEAIATRLGCGPSTIGRRLRDLDIPRRPPGPAARRGGRREWPDPPPWSSELAWLVGLIATDGNLTRTGRGLSIASVDVQLLEDARRCLGLGNRLTRSTGGWGHRGLRLQWRSKALYDWLLRLGLTPRKSLTLGPLAIPDELFPDFSRGCVDGDGTVLVYTDRHHARANEAYEYQRLYVSLVSASERFVHWVRATIQRLLGLRGAIHQKRKPGHRPVWVLRYAKRASVLLLRWIYYARDVPCLERKRRKAEPFLAAPP